LVNVVSKLVKRTASVPALDDGTSARHAHRHSHTPVDPCDSETMPAELKVSATAKPTVSSPPITTTAPDAQPPPASLADQFARLFQGSTPQVAKSNNVDIEYDGSYEVDHNLSDDVLK
jgi:hypothetical protein